MGKSTSCYPLLAVEATGSGVVSQAGAVALARTAQASGLSTALSAALRPWRKPLACHDPGKVITDLAISLAIGGDCLADVAVLRTQPQVFGAVASDPTVSRLITSLAADGPNALAAINAARAVARSAAWTAAGDRAPDHEADEQHPVIIDLDASLVGAHSEKEHAAPTYKRGFGFHPLCAFVDHGAAGTGEPVAILLRPGNAGANTAADHKKILWMRPWRSYLATPVTGSARKFSCAPTRPAPPTNSSTTCTRELPARAAAGLLDRIRTH